MRVARLEVFGFKSFMERLLLPLETGITGIVGPNGCGKSNIVDALRWILGETRARSLRGDVLEDVIFNGTDKLRPLGLAEVGLTLRSGDKDFFDELSGIELERDAVAELEDAVSSIPEVPEEVRQVLAAEEAEKVRNAEEEALKRRAQLTVIQGNLGAEQPDPKAELEVLVKEVRPDDYEHAPQAPRQETEKPKRRSPSPESKKVDLLTRFAWLKGIAEIQVTRRLYRSGESEFFINRVPCRLKDLKELFRVLGVGARTYTIVAQGEVSRIVTARPDERRMIMEEAAGVLGFRDKIAAAGKRLEETTVNVSRLDDILKEVGRQVDVLRRQASRARNRQQLKEKISGIDRLLFGDEIGRQRAALEKFQLEIENARTQEGNCDAALQRVQALEHESRNVLMTLDVEGDSIRSRIDAVQDELASRNRLETSRRSRLGEIQALLQASDVEEQRVNERSVLLEERAKQCQLDIGALQEQSGQLEASLAEVSAGSDGALKDLSDHLGKLREDLKVKNSALYAAREELAAARSGLAVIEEELTAASPLMQLRRTAGERGAELFGEKARLLIDGLRIPHQYTRAVQAVLAEKAGYVVLDNPHALARELAAEVSQPAGERYAIGLMRAGSRTGQLRDGAVPFPALLDLIEVADDCRLAAAHLFQSVYLAETLDEALNFFEQQQEGAGLYSNLQVVTQAGEIVDCHSFFSLKHEGGLLQLKGKADQCRSVILRASENEAALLREVAGIEAELRQGQDRQQQLLEEMRSRQAEAAKISSELGGVKGRLAAEKRLLDQVRLDSESAASQKKELSQRAASLLAEKERITAELVSLAPADEPALREGLEKARREYQELEGRRREERSRLSEHSLELEACRESLDQARAAVSGLSLEIQKIQLEQSSLKERITTEYGEELCVELLSSTQKTAELTAEDLLRHREEVARLKARILREGEVDPESIERYEHEAARFKDLTRQRQDLAEAAATLKRTIEKLTETSVKRFVSVFENVSRNFESLIPRLFGGGRGSLALIDPSRPLETGIEINVRPPGKKLRSIDLLSGGEKALCATALIFSMFLERPSPLCVLDEVDAPLDEANLIRFLSMIREMSSRTQFLLITHNKQTMALADNLIGVTMQEPGSSRIISVSLQEAISQVA